MYPQVRTVRVALCIHKIGLCTANRTTIQMPIKRKGYNGVTASDFPYLVESEQRKWTVCKPKACQGSTLYKNPSDKKFLLTYL